MPAPASPRFEILPIGRTLASLKCRFNAAPLQNARNGCGSRKPCLMAGDQPDTPKEEQGVHEELKRRVCRGDGDVQQNGPNSGGVTRRQQFTS